jgi:hypothetical protein
MLKSLLRTTACLAVSAAAFIVIARMDAAAGGGRTRGTPPETDAAKAAPPKPTNPKPAPPPSTPKLTIESGTLEGSRPPRDELPPAKPAYAHALASLNVPAPPAAATATTRTDTRGAVTLPDWKGKRLSVARREARKLGLNVTAVDDSGDAVPAAEASSYRVRRMLTKAGTAVEPGADVELRVREIFDAAGGY